MFSSVSCGLLCQSRRSYLFTVLGVPALGVRQQRLDGSMTLEIAGGDTAVGVSLARRSGRLAVSGRPLDHLTRRVLNRPHEEPSRYWQLAEDNTSTGVMIEGRRLSQALVIVPKERGAQLRMQVTADQVVTPIV